MNRIPLLTFLSFILIAPANAGGDSLKAVRILHWNDFHSQNTPFIPPSGTEASELNPQWVGGAAALYSRVLSLRAESIPTLILSAGDEFQGTPISTLSKGMSQILLLNKIRPDAMVLGNHEFDYGAGTLRDRIEKASFPIVTANILDTADARPFAEPFHIYRFPGVRVGLTGLAPPDLKTLVLREALENWDAVPPDSVFPEILNRFRRDSVDLIVVLSHMGFHEDSLLALRHPDIDVIVGGHDHRVFHSPRTVGRSVIVQAGSRGQFLGVLNLIVDVRGDSLFELHGNLQETLVDSLALDHSVRSIVDSLEQSVAQVMDERIGELLIPWKRPPHGKRSESEVGNWQADVMREYAGTDIAFQNAGGIRTEVSAGPLTVGTMWRLNPFGNSFVTFAVAGKQLKAMIEFQLGASLRELVQWSGLRVTFNSALPEGQRIIEATVGGKPIREEILYTAVTNNYVASNLSTHFGVEPSAVVMHTLPVIDRDVFVARVRSDRFVRSSLDGRMTDIAEGGPTKP